MKADDLLVRLASLTVKLFERQRLVYDCREKIELLEKEGFDQVSGERQLLAEMEPRLESAFDLLRTIDGGSPANCLEALELLVDDVSWDVAAELQPDMESKLRNQLAMVGEAKTQLKAWINEVAELDKVVNDARMDGARFSMLEADRTAARSRLNSLGNALDDRVYVNLGNQLETAKKTIMEFADRVSKTQEQIQRVKALVRQADLLIMQTGQEGDEYEYSVLLRSADRTQTRGINIIQDERKLDRDYLMNGIAELTDDINVRLRTDHASRLDTGGERGVSFGAEPSAPVKPHPDIQVAMRGLGQFMWKMLIPEQMRELIRSQNCSLSITTNDLELPWELICIEDPAGASEFLCVSKSVSRMPLGNAFPQPGNRRRSAVAKPRMLLIYSDRDGNLPAAADEVNTIAEQLGSRLEIVRLGPLEATNARLIRALTEDPPFDFIHYAGHASFNKEKPNDSGLILKDKVFKVDKIRNLNRGGSLVFLNACESGMVARVNEPQQVCYLLNNPKPVVGLASAFVYSGALGCVGSLWPVYDRAAAELAVKFYGFVLDGDPTGEALRRARFDIRSKYPDGCTWAGYVLYGDPTFRLTED
jgi:hypothetical protein